VWLRLGKLCESRSIRPIRWTAFLRSWHHYQGNQRGHDLDPSFGPHAACPLEVASRSPSQSRSRLANPNPYSQEPMSHLSNGYQPELPIDCRRR